MATSHRPVWASASHRAASRLFPRALDRHLIRAHLLASPVGSETPLKARAASPFFYLSFSLFWQHRRLALPLNTAAVGPSPAKSIVSIHSPLSRAPLRSPRTSQFRPERPHDHLLHLRWPSATEPPHVASHLHRLSTPAGCSTALAVSCWCFPCLQFSRYWLVSSECRDPWPPCRHGQWDTHSRVSAAEPVSGVVRGVM
jgi:hypothetical protein